VAQEVVLDIDFAGIENVRRLFETLGEEADLRQYVEAERLERILKISKLSKSKLYMVTGHRNKDRGKPYKDGWILCHLDSVDLQSATDLRRREVLKPLGAKSSSDAAKSSNLSMLLILSGEYCAIGNGVSEYAKSQERGYDLCTLPQGLAWSYLRSIGHL